MPPPASPRRALPPQWASELAPHALPAARGGAPRTGAAFDARLDAFLDALHAELVAARAAKDAGGPGGAFRARMDAVRALYAAEGRDFACVLEERYPGFWRGVDASKASEAGYGEDTVELARGIERLESAVRAEEGKRGASPVVLDGKYKARVEAPRREDDLGLSTLHSDETLCLMQSDIQALKLELLRLQRSKAASGSPRRLPLYLDPSFTLSTVTPPAAPAARAASTLEARARELAPPHARRYVSHLEQMKSRLDALERKPLAHPRATRNVARIGRTKTMSNLYSVSRGRDVPASGSGSSLPRPSAAGDENAPPEFVTPPRKRPQDRPERAVNVVRALGDEDFHSPPESVSSLSPSPVGKPRTGRARTTVGAAVREQPRPEKEEQKNAGLFSIDAPEELLSRPQSYAAARDIQRYSLKVARRLGPVPGNAAAADEAPPPAVVRREHGRRGHGDGVAAAAAPPPAKVQHSPASFAGVAAASDALQAFATSPTGASARPGPARSEMRPPAGGVQAMFGGGAHGKRVHDTPSSMDTTNSGGSGGRVVEEIEGEMWVRKGSLWKRWRRRYASIVTHQFFGRVLCLFGYDSSGKVQSTKSEVIVLNGALCRSIRDTVDLGGETQHVFVLRTARDYYMAISSDPARRAWVRELRQAARSAPNPHPAAAAAAKEEDSGHAHPQAQAPAPVPLKAVANRLPSRKSAMGIGRAVTHHGSHRAPMAQSGGIPAGQRQRRGPFRRPVNL